MRGSEIQSRAPKVRSVLQKHYVLGRFNVLSCIFSEPTETRFLNFTHFFSNAKCSSPVDLKQRFICDHLIPRQPALRAAEQIWQLLLCVFFSFLAGGDLGEGGFGIPVAVACSWGWRYSPEVHVKGVDRTSLRAV